MSILMLFGFLMEKKEKFIRLKSSISCFHMFVILSTIRLQLSEMNYSIAKK